MLKKIKTLKTFRNTKIQNIKMNKTILTILAVAFILFESNKGLCQYLNIFAGAKFPEYSTSNIKLTYLDESPVPDLFTTNT